MSPDIIYVVTQKVWWFLVVLGVLVTFHEFGHFIVARWAGVRVLKFSLGFGPRLLSRQIGDTEYIVSAVPLGGYVKMFGEDLGDVVSPEEREQSFVHQPLWKRTLIVAAGPGFNFLLSYLIFSAWLATGSPLPVPTIAELSPTIDAIKANSPADAAGLQVGDRILTINEQDVPTRSSVYAAIADSRGRPLTVEVRRANALKAFVVTPTLYDPDDPENPVYVIGIEAAPPLVTSVMPDTPAERAGLADGDRILAIQGDQIHTWTQMTTIVRAHPNEPLTMEVEREAARITLTVTPDPHEVTEEGHAVTIGKIGIMGPGRSVVRASSPFTAVVQGAKATWRWSELTVVGLYKMITGDIALNNVGGPLMIASASGTAAERGLPDVTFFVAVLSINLGILNLLPIPILDGGHLFFFACEAVLGRPLAERQREVAQQIGIVLLFGIMIFAFFNDVQRMLQ